MIVNLMASHNRFIASCPRGEKEKWKIERIAFSPNYKYYPDSLPDVIVEEKTGCHLPKDLIDTHISVYEDRVKGWFLQYGEELQKTHNAGFVVLQVALAQVEGIEPVSHRRVKRRTFKAILYQRNEKGLRI